MLNLQTLQQLEYLKKTEQALLILFGGRDCNVCHAIKPKLIDLITDRYPKMKMVYVDCHVVIDACSQNGVLSLPTLQVFFSGKRFIQEVRTFSLTRVVNEIERPYAMAFES